MHILEFLRDFALLIISIVSILIILMAIACIIFWLFGLLNVFGQCLVLIALWIALICLNESED